MGLNYWRGNQAWEKSRKDGNELRGGHSSLGCGFWVIPELDLGPGSGFGEFCEN